MIHALPHCNSKYFMEQIGKDTRIYNKNKVCLLKRHIETIGQEDSVQVDCFDSNENPISSLIVHKCHDKQNNILNALVAKFDFKNTQNNIVRYFTRNTDGNLELSKECNFIDFITARVNAEKNPELTNLLCAPFRGLLQECLKEMFSK